MSSDDWAGERGRSKHGGMTGPKGDAGAQGNQGIQGPQGVPGNTGSQGPAGIQGPQGVPGPTGSTGATGAAGSQGPAGVVNVRGPWVSSSSYAVGDAVTYLGNTYVAKTATGAPTNLLTGDASTFESGVGGWQGGYGNTLPSILATGSPTLTSDTAQFHSGAASLKVVQVAGTQHSWAVSPAVSVSSGVSYTFSVWMRYLQAAYCDLYMDGSVTGSWVAQTVGSWTQYSRTVTASTTTMQVGIKFGNDAAGRTIWLDDATLTIASGTFDTSLWDLLTPGALPTFTTAARPAASALGVGNSYYDTTLGKPVWSTGSAYKDASGTTV